MVQQRFRTLRMVLRSSSADDVRAFAEENSWILVLNQPADPDSGVRRELVWEAAPRVRMTYVEDDMSGNSFVTVGGEDPNLTSSIGGWVEEQLHPWRLKDLCRLVDVARDPVRVGLAVLRLALGAPYECTPEVFERIAKALEHEDERTRDMAIWATTYSPWPEYKPILRRIAQSDPEPKLRDRAQLTLESYDAAGVGDS
jgi:hypothetical protein